MTNVFSKAELKVLTKFRKGVTVSDTDKEVLNKYAAIGFVKTGFNWDTMKETARLTKIGIEHL